mgnify:CR=1 FL=1
MDLPLYVSPIAQTIADRHGNTQEFKAGEPAFIGRPLLDIARAAGIEPYTGAQPQAPKDAFLTVEEVAAGIRTIMEAGDKKAFSTTGEPKLAALRKVLGVQVTDAERDAAWELIKSEA